MPTSSTSSSRRRRTYIRVLAFIDPRPQAHLFQFQTSSVREHSHRHAHTGEHRAALAQYIPPSIYASKIPDRLHDIFAVYARNNVVASVRQDERRAVASGQADSADVSAKRDGGDMGAKYSPAKEDVNAKRRTQEKLDVRFALLAQSPSSSRLAEGQAAFGQSMAPAGDESHGGINVSVGVMSAHSAFGWSKVYRSDLDFHVSSTMRFGGGLLQHELQKTTIDEQGRSWWRRRDWVLSEHDVQP